MLYFFPIILIFMSAVFIIILNRKFKSSSMYIDLGMIFIVICSVYGMIPSVGFLLTENGIGYIKDNRILGYFDIRSVEHVQLLFLLFFIGFGSAYCLFRKQSEFVPSNIKFQQKYLTATLSVYLMCLMSVPAIKYLLGVNFSEDYIGTYLELRNYPIILQQIFNVIDQLTFSFMVASVVFALRYRPQWGKYIFLALTINMIYASLSGGSRTTAFLGFIAYVVAASIFVRPVSFIRLLPVGFLSLMLFMAAGYWRGQAGENPVLTAIQGGEFMALFINSVDLSERVLSGEAASFLQRLVIADIAKMVPSQLWLGQKLDPATWYAETFYPAYYAAGGGFAFGALSEAVMGFGVADAVVRGLLLGAIFGYAGNRLMGRNATIFSVFVYVWLIVICYQSYRDTTFSFLARSIYQVVPLYLLLRFIGSPPGQRAT